MLPTKAERIKSLTKPQGRVGVRKFNKADDLIDEVYCDICNGASRSDVLKKITEGTYKNCERKFSKATAQKYYSVAMKRFAVNTDIKLEEMRNVFFSRYEAVLEQCIKNGDMFNARATLDSMAKIFGVGQTPQTAIQINSDKENGVTINFGFKTQEENIYGD